MVPTHSNSSPPGISGSYMAKGLKNGDSKDKIYSYLCVEITEASGAVNANGIMNDSVTPFMYEGTTNGSGSYTLYQHVPEQMPIEVVLERDATAEGIRLTGTWKVVPLESLECEALKQFVRKQKEFKEQARSGAAQVKQSPTPPSPPSTFTPSPTEPSKADLLREANSLVTINGPAEAKGIIELIRVVLPVSRREQAQAAEIVALKAQFGKMQTEFVKMQTEFADVKAQMVKMQAQKPPPSTFPTAPPPPAPTPSFFPARPVFPNQPNPFTPSTPQPITVNQTVYARKNNRGAWDPATVTAVNTTFFADPTYDITFKRTGAKKKNVPANELKRS